MDEQQRTLVAQQRSQRQVHISSLRAVPPLTEKFIVDTSHGLGGSSLGGETPALTVPGQARLCLPGRRAGVLAFVAHYL